MYQISLLNQLLKEYKLWTLKLQSASKNIENNILQKDTSSKFEEKIMSIGIASIFIWIVTGIAGLFGVASGGFLVGVILFAIGWLLSKLITKVVFGTPRKIQDLSDDEKELLESIKKVLKTHIDIRDKINKNTIVVNFTNYVNLKKEFDNLIYELENFNAIHLALKYRYKHKFIVSRYKIEVDKFNKIYAHK
jgi:hypothetical protein